MLFAGVSDAEIIGRAPVLMAEKTVNVIVSAVLAATPLYEHIARRWVFYYMVHQLMSSPLART